MREPSPDSEAFGLLAEFDQAERLIEGVRQARGAGFRRVEAYSPFPIDELKEALGIEGNGVAWLTLAGGLLGAALGYGLQVYGRLDYRIDVGGRPLVATPGLLLTTIVLTILFAVLFSIVGMLALNRLPRLHHPLFDVEGFGAASSDRFFLLVFSDDDAFHAERTRAFLEGMDPLRVELVGHTEEPE